MIMRCLEDKKFQYCLYGAKKTLRRMMKHMLWIVTPKWKNIITVHQQWTAKKGMLRTGRTLDSNLGLHMGIQRGYARQEYWLEKNLDALHQQIAKFPNTNIAKNVIFFLGDGMSITTITSARILDGQRRGGPGENNYLSWETFPFTGLSKTYCVDKLVADSACSGTAYWSGVKANLGTLGVTAQVKMNDCNAVNRSTSVKTLLDYGQEAGKATGIVTTTRVTHASPAAGYAHISNRNYESDADVVDDQQNPYKCGDIAKQLVLSAPGNNLNVILGGGTSKFLPENKSDPFGNAGSRLDNIDLVEEWLNDKRTRFGEGREEVVWDVQGLENVNYENTTHLFGIFSPTHMSYNLEADRNKEPSLAKMTESAIKLLKKNQNGFILFVEGGKIDLGHHATQAAKALDETVELSKAVATAMELTNPLDTLIMVTSDHSHTMSISGYPGRGSDILKFAGTSDIDGMPYTILSYANGIKAGRNSISSNKLGHPDSLYPALTPLVDETHSGEDVAVYSSGPWSQLLSGVFEQSLIPTTLMYASCIGPSLTACNHYNFRQPKLVHHSSNN
ncbi:alkaline phosphatase 1 isoform X3 [Rhodnius prolixus]|uniref:alkaline phosphatase 1 isoform X3 n=1 Tax=Rhodnius prolixus TaxID=13249 RepID=UPI003D18AB65